MYIQLIVPTKRFHSVYHSWLNSYSPILAFEQCKPSLPSIEGCPKSWSRVPEGPQPHGRVSGWRWLAPVKTSGPPSQPSSTKNTANWCVLGGSAKCRSILWIWSPHQKLQQTTQTDATQKGGEIKRKVVSLLISHQYKLYIHRNINHSRKCRKISRQPIFAESTSCSAKCCSAIPCFRPGLPPWSRLPVEDFSDTAESLQTV